MGVGKPALLSVLDVAKSIHLFLQKMVGWAKCPSHHLFLSFFHWQIGIKTAAR
jgi:hypothetical protein